MSKRRHKRTIVEVRYAPTASPDPRQPWVVTIKRGLRGKREFQTCARNKELATDKARETKDSLNPSNDHMVQIIIYNKTSPRHTEWTYPRSLDPRGSKG